MASQISRNLSSVGIVATILACSLFIASASAQIHPPVYHPPPAFHPPPAPHLVVRAPESYHPYSAAEGYHPTVTIHPIPHATEHPSQSVSHPITAPKTGSASLGSLDHHSFGGGGSNHGGNGGGSNGGANGSGGGLSRTFNKAAVGSNVGKSSAIPTGFHSGTSTSSSTHGTTTTRTVSGTASVADLGRAKSAAQMASELRAQIGRNSVKFQTANKAGHIDLEGAAHGGVPTPHVQEAPLHRGSNGKANLGKPVPARPAEKCDIRIAKNIVKRNNGQ